MHMVWNAKLTMRRVVCLPIQALGEALLGHYSHECFMTLPCQSLASTVHHNMEVTKSADTCYFYTVPLFEPSIAYFCMLG